MSLSTRPAGRRLPTRLAAVNGTAATVCLAAMLVGCGQANGGSSGAPAAASTSAGAGASGQGASGNSQAPVSAEHNPPGDIPDTTVYVPYVVAAAHAQIKVPEGWARQNSTAGSTFSSNLNSIAVAPLPMSAAPTVVGALSSTVPTLRRSSLAFRLSSVRAVTLPAGPAVEIIYQVNSQPNAVTGRQYRLVIERFEVYKNGRGAVLSLSSAVGSDNVDPWRIVSQSFGWA